MLKNEFRQRYGYFRKDICFLEYDDDISHGLRWRFSKPISVFNNEFLDVDTQLGVATLWREKNSLTNGARERLKRFFEGVPGHEYDYHLQKLQEFDPNLYGVQYYKIARFIGSKLTSITFTLNSEGFID
jgi:hypothetical protein